MKKVEGELQKLADNYKGCAVPGVAPKSNMCFVMGTLLALANGSRVPIEQVRLGQRVLTWKDSELGYRELFTNLDTLIDPTQYPQKALGPRGKAEMASHTEAKALTIVELQPGDTMVITGQDIPCTPCRGAFNKAASESGATIQCRWRQNGETWVWEAGRGLIQKGLKAETGATLKLG